MKRSTMYKQNLAMMSGLYEREMAYWEQKLSQQSAFSSFRVKSEVCYGLPHRAESMEFCISPVVAGKLNDMANGSEYAVFAVLLSAYAAVLQRFARISRIITGVPVFKDGVQETEAINDLLLLKLEAGKEEAVKDLIFRAGAEIQNAVGNQNAPVRAILNKIGFSLEEGISMVGYEQIHDLSIVEEDRIRTGFMFRRDGKGLCLCIHYDENLHDRYEIASMGQAFCCVLEQILDNPHQKLRQIAMMTAEEMQCQVQQSWGESRPAIAETFLSLFEKQLEQHGESAALARMQEVLTYRQLSERTNQIAHLLIRCGIRAQNAFAGILIENSIEQGVAVVAVQRAGMAYVPLDPKLPYARLATMLLDTDPVVIFVNNSSSELGMRMMWERKTIRAVINMEDGAYQEAIQKKNALMDQDLWEIVGQQAEDAIEAGGWKNSYTGAYFSPKEMDEYAENALVKLRPYLNKKTRVLEIGCASGLTMYKAAPFAGYYYGTDLSSAVIRQNARKNKECGYENIGLAVLPAHHIDRIDESDFNVIVMNSVVQCFHGFQYLLEVIKKAVGKMAPRGILFIGDVMDQEKKEDLIRSLRIFKEQNECRFTKTDWSEELFLCRDFFYDLVHEIPGIAEVEITEKVGTIANELTCFRYDVLLKIDKRKSVQESSRKRYFTVDDINRQSTEDPGIAVAADDTAYAIHTSGTTGTPKAIVVSHRALANLCSYGWEYFNLEHTSQCTRYAGFGFDASVWELFPALAAGACVHIIDHQTRFDLDKLHTYICDRKITHCFLPTQVAEQFIERYEEGPSVLMTGGDKMQYYRPVKYRVCNNYGPAENTVLATTYEVHKMSPNIPIGRPVFNAQVFVMDENLRIQPPGAVGEIYCAGASLSSGYLNQEKLTLEKFIDNPYGDGLIYRTGDLGRYRNDGNIEFLGRMDDQVQIRGYRTEVKEIQKIIRNHPAVREVFVYAREDKRGNKYLCAYYTLKAKGLPAKKNDLQQYAGQYLPAYMVPVFWIAMENLPVNENGKIDKGQLPDPLHCSTDTVVAARDEQEQILLTAWEQILDKRPISVFDNFFDIGGNSLKAIQLIGILQEHGPLSINDIFLYQTVEEQAGYLRQNSQGGSE